MEPGDSREYSSFEVKVALIFALDAQLCGYSTAAKLLHGSALRLESQFTGERFDGPS